MSQYVWEIARRFAEKLDKRTQYYEKTGEMLDKSGLFRRPTYTLPSSTSGFPDQYVVENRLCSEM